MKNILKIATLLGVLFALAVGASAQTAMTITTLSAAVTTGPAGISSGVSGSYQTQITLASSSGVTAAFLGTQPVSFGYVDQELVGFISNPSGNIWNVLRGQMGTKAAPHASGATVYIQTGSAQFSGGGSGSGGLQLTDPQKGNCTAASTLFTPWINVTTGRQWICDTATTNWLPVLSTGSITPTATAAAIGVALQTFALNGVIANEPLQVVVQPAPTALCPLVSVRASAANTVQLGFAVLTAAACTPAAGTYMFFAAYRFN